MRGDTIAGRYRVERLLGVGSSGFVVAARHVRLDRRVALKVLTTLTTAQGKAVLAVAHRVAALRSANVARVVDTGLTEEGYPFIASSLAEGRTLAELLAEHGSLPAREAVSLVLQACIGLADAHAADVVHGDLKPQNLLLTKGGVLEVLDFGMMQPLESEEGSAAWFASPAYLAPEQLRDPEVDARADVWALGVILHQLIAGKLPFDAETIAGMFVAVAYHEPALLAAPDVPYELAKIVRACLAKDPAGRPPTVRALARDLAPFGDVRPTLPSAQAPAPAPAPAPRGNAAPSVAPQLAMAVSLDDASADVRVGDDARDGAEESLASSDVLPFDTVTRMVAAVKRAASGPPPLPGHHLGATSLPNLGADLSKMHTHAKGWLAKRLRAATKPLAARADAEGGWRAERAASKPADAKGGWLRAARPKGSGLVERLRAATTPADMRSEAERSFQRRRWGAIGVVAGAGVLFVVSLFAPSPAAPPAAAAAAAATLEPVESLIVERPLRFGTSTFVPPSFALPEREERVAAPPAGPFKAAVIPPPPPPPGPRSAPPRPRLSVRDDPYAPPRPAATTRTNANGFTHPARLPERGRSRTF
ncbi:MAG: serine/threonine protein kinase [Labilithrix sp.]|nr:serine/threonine protein kinase [Labilithrix sp.]MCW5814185.1 serine/threonine protein kinase [Labilithrix sp.]